MRERTSVEVLNRFSGHLMQFISMLRKNHLGKLSTLGPGSALREKGEKSQGGWKKKKQLASEASREVVWGG